MPFRCFAYGSNMFTRKMLGPAPSATLVSTGRLRGHVVRFNKKSDDGSGKGNIVATGNGADEVWGVIFEVADEHRSRLDKSEGGYIPTEIDVLSETESVRCIAYVARAHRIDDSLKPYTWYKEFVVRGAEDHGLPPEYVAQLGHVEAVGDPDPARDAQQRELLGAPRTLTEALQRVETSTEPFEPHDVADSVRRLIREAEADRKELTPDMRAEWLAFTLAEDYIQLALPWMRMASGSNRRASSRSRRMLSPIGRNELAHRGMRSFGCDTPTWSGNSAAAQSAPYHPPFQGL
jgi:hypothetical protein